MPKRMIQNNNGGPIQVQMPHLAAQNRPPGGDKTVHLGPVLVLPPGLKMVDSAMWEEAKKNDVVKALLKEAIPRSRAPEQDQEMVGRKRLVEGREVPDESPLAKLKPTEVLRMIEETLDVETLRDWLKTEQRTELRKAIEKQIGELEAPFMSTGGSTKMDGAPAQEGDGTP